MERARTIILGFAVLTAVYLYSLPSATIPYLAIVLAHIAAGCVLTGLLIATRPRSAGWLVTSGGALLGIALIWTGAARSFAPLIYGHIGLCALGLIILLATRTGRPALSFAVYFAVALAVAGSAWAVREVRWRNAYPIRNPDMPPQSQEAEGDGVNGRFFPSSAQTSHGGLIPSKFFMDSKACQRCHPDIYEQWSSSAHRFSSFDNQWYRKSIEYMQDVIGVKPSKWCAGCHDPALLFSGMFDTPVRQLLDKPEAHAGLGCVMCHSIAGVKSTMGQGDFTLEYPALAELAASPNRIVQVLHDFLVHVNPEPHRRTFLKPFVRNQTGDFCSTCHKVHLDTHVNSYRWVRGFDDYDNWQASGVSGLGSRSFYYPDKSSTCADCHMPMLPSHDAGNVNGKIHSHRFPGANTALPTVNNDPKQMDAVVKFLQNSILSLDVFGLSPAREIKGTGSAATSSPLATTFAVGEEGDVGAAAGGEVELAPLTGPLDRVNAVVRPGETYRVDVVVRTRKIGHFFPGGTVDAFDVWLELQATDDSGRVIFWSGSVENEGKGPVDKGAHFYRSLQLDGNGNPINKRNAWATRSLAYVRLIPPGAADTVHYRIAIPKDVRGRINLKASLHYRKFAWWNTQFAFAGERAPGSPAAAKDFDNGKWVFTGDTSKVSGQIKSIPDVPIITLAESKASLTIDTAGTANSRGVTVDPKDWGRWNDYGIGLLLQGDLKGAVAAFTRATEANPKNPDGFVNIGRALVQEGDLDGARTALEKALMMSPDLARAHFFYSRVLRSEGRYDEALAHLRRVIAQYPEDRVVRNDAGRVLFLQKKYAEAIREFQAVLAIDPEDVQAHYNLMLCYNGLGDRARAEEHQKRYLRFKADESCTGDYGTATGSPTLKTTMSVNRYTSTLQGV